MGVLKQVAEAMKTDQATKFEIGGHTDADGAADHNLVLSTQRAEAVKRQLEAMGVQGSRLTCKGFGESLPIAPNDTQEGKAKNRRVEFIKK
jgi:outer membrane protein OmpA-like peptidoglycan-associated protein